MTTPTRKHRAPDRIRELEQQAEARERQVEALGAAADRMVESVLRGVQDATELHELRQKYAELQAAYRRLEAQRNAEIEAMRREIADRDRRLAIAARADAAVTKTQPLSTEQIKAGLADRRSIPVVPLWEAPLAKAAT